MVTPHTLPTVKTSRTHSSSSNHSRKTAKGLQRTSPPPCSIHSYRKQHLGDTLTAPRAIRQPQVRLTLPSHSAIELQGGTLRGLLASQETQNLPEGHRGQRGWLVTSALRVLWLEGGPE